MHRSANTQKQKSLRAISVDIEDSSYRSEYFIITDLPSVFTAGKNYLSINGSNKLKKNTNILLEILDSDGKYVYYEIGKSGYISYKETTDLVVSVHVYDTTASGFGSITLVGTRTDGKLVRWTSTIKIDPTMDNSSRVVFFDTPKLEKSEFLSYVLNEGWTTLEQYARTISGSIVGVALSPKVFSDIAATDYRKTEIDYRLKYSSPTDPTLTLFCRENEQSDLTIHITEISIPRNNSVQNIAVDITSSAKIKSVVNSTELKLVDPITYVVDGVERIVPIVSGSIVQTFFATSYITSSGLVSGSSIDGDPDPNVFLQKPVGATYAFLREPFVDVTYKNLKTLTGKIHRHKIYRKSLNKASDFECIADEPLLETETLFDTATANRAFAKLGEFYNIDHILRYYHTSSADLSITQSSDSVLNSMELRSVSENQDLSKYIIVKNDTSLLTFSQSKANYVGYNDAQSVIKSGSAYDSNFITLHSGTDYLISADLDLVRLNSDYDSKLVFYFTSSNNPQGLSQEPEFSGVHGIKLHEYVIPAGEGRVSFSGKHDGKILKFQNDYHGTLVIVPVNLRFSNISNLSLKTFAEFGFSPDVFSTRVYFPVTIKNEQYELKSEFLDINNKSIYSGLRTIINIDKDGQTLFKNITNYLITDSETIRSVVSSGSLTISASRQAGGLGYDSSTNRASLSVVESFVVQSGSANDRYPFFIAEFGPGNVGPTVRISGSLILTGSMRVTNGNERLYATSSWAVSSSYSFVASSSLSSSGAQSALSSSWSISSSYSFVASSSLSSSGAQSALSSSWSISSSYAYKASSSLSSSGAEVSISSSHALMSNTSSHLVYASGIAPVGSPALAGYLTATLGGTRIYVPYYTSV
jgi:hypothetical protein